MTSQELLSSLDDCGNEIFGGFIWSSPKIKLNKRELWGRAWSNSGPALEHGRQLCPEQDTHRVEAGSNGTCTTLVTPDLDACPKLTREAKLKGAFLLGLLCREKTLL